MGRVAKQPGRAAFEIKGPRQVMTLSEKDVEKYLDLQEPLVNFRAKTRPSGSIIPLHPTFLAAAHKVRHSVAVPMSLSYKRNRLGYHRLTVRCLLMHLSVA
jgi:hypothetical protein